MLQSSEDQLLKLLKAIQSMSKQFKQLMKTVDEKIPTPAREVDKPFLMPIEDVFSISGRGTVATGRVERGVVKINDKLATRWFGRNKRNSCYWS